MKMPMSEWVLVNSPRFDGDAQSFYYNQLRAILRGDIENGLSYLCQDHSDALEAEHQAFLKSFDIELQPF